jgi:O-methyltransferase
MSNSLRAVQLKTVVKLAFDVLRGREPFDVWKYYTAEAAAGLFYPKAKFSEYGRVFLNDAEFQAAYDRLVGPANQHSYDRKYSLDQLMKLAATVPGDTAECGCLRGASSYFICRRIAGTGKEHHVFDSFEGLSKPGEHDGTWWTKHDFQTPEAVVAETLKDFPFAKLHKGWIPDRFPDVKDKKFSLVHVDVDLYEPTLDSFKFFYPRMSKGGLIVCDDYGYASCPGAKKAMDEFFADKKEKVLSLPTGQGVVFTGVYS